MTTSGFSYQRGAFIAYEPGGSNERRRVIPFRYNPESLSRSVQIEQGTSTPPTTGATPGAADPATERSASAAAGALKESFTIQIRFDFADRLEAASNLPDELGVAPEIAALEELMYPVETERDAPNDGSEPVTAAPPRPVVLFVWGRKRVVPVRITQLTINETMYNTDLNPVRAEIDVAVEVLGRADAAENPTVRSALDFTFGNRRQLARLFYDNTADQGSRILPL